MDRFIPLRAIVRPGKTIRAAVLLLLVLATSPAAALVAPPVNVRVWSGESISDFESLGAYQLAIRGDGEMSVVYVDTACDLTCPRGLTHARWSLGGWEQLPIPDTPFKAGDVDAIYAASGELVVAYAENSTGSPRLRVLRGASGGWTEQSGPALTHAAPFVRMDETSSGKLGFMVRETSPGGGGTRGNISFLEQTASGWTRTALARGTSAGTFLHFQFGFAYDSLDRPHVVWAQTGSGILHAWRDASGWHTEVVAAGAFPAPAFATLAIGADDRIHVAYMGEDTSYWHAQRDAAGWTLAPLDPEPATGKMGTLHVDASGGVHTAYLEEPDLTGARGRVRYAHLAPGAAQWWIERIEPTGSANFQHANVGLDPVGAPHVVYWVDQPPVGTSERGHIRHATPIDPLRLV